MLISTTGFNIIKGPLHAHPKNPRYFTGNGKRVIYLAGVEYWDILREDCSPDPRAVDFEKFLDIVTRYHLNFVRLWRWNELFKFSYPKENKMFGKKTYFTSPSPWLRVGPWLAKDGKPKFDLTKFDESYFKQLRERVEMAGKRGIFVSVMLFEGHSIQFSEEPWRWEGHPFNKDNNVNGIDGDADGDGLGTEIHTLKLPEVTRIQEAYVRKVIDTLNDLDNVLYEIANESHSQSTEWQYHIVHFIKQYEAKKPKQHPVWISTHGGGPANSLLFNSPADCIAPSPEGGYGDDPPPNEGRKVILSDTDHLWGAPGDYQWVWKTFTRGMNPINYAELEDIVKPTPKLENALKAMGVTRLVAEQIDLVDMIPHPELASTRYCLANPGKKYLVYLPEGGDVMIDLSPAPGVFAIKWIHPITGRVITGKNVEGGKKLNLLSPLKGASVLYLAKVEYKR
ncbi:hypothetical protein H5T87_10895 [bacterium]|nr:hypothetical protein [bacterium]